MDITRADLVQTDSTMNQLRNAIFQLARLIKNKGNSKIEERLRIMGRNIARTYINYWKPIDIVNYSNIKDFIKTVYLKIMNSSVSIEINESDKIIRVKDTKCALCKYHYEDINIAGCEILLGLVSELIFIINKQKKDPSAIFLEAFKVEESKALGHEHCIQVYKYKTGGV